MYYLKLVRKVNGDTTPVVYVGPYDNVVLEAKNGTCNNRAKSITCYDALRTVLETFLVDMTSGTEIVAAPYTSIIGTVVHDADLQWHTDIEEGIPTVPPFTLELQDKLLRSEGLYEVALQALVEYIVTVEADNVEDAITRALDYDGPGKVVQRVTDPTADRDKVVKLT